MTPRETADFLGHEQAVASLAAGAAGGRLHHAWLIGGPPGIGKATLAFRFARHLLAGGTAPDLAVAPEHPVFRRVAAGSHPDLLVIERKFDEKRKRLQGEIVMETVSQVSRFLRLTPAEGGWRVVIVDGAEEMNRNAANALLKLLEEPPARAILLLVSHAPGRLLPTIRSRCRRLFLAPLPEPVVSTLLARAAPELGAADRGRIAGIAEGSIGAAMALAAEDGLLLAGLVDEVLDAETALPAARLAAIAEQAGASDERFTGFIALLRASLSAAVRAAARDAADPDQARIASRRSLAASAALWQELGRIEAETSGLHLDRRATLLTAIASFQGQ